ncbi:TonB-dependent receptor [Pseudomonas lopnurensis]|uniref:TonB-dependent receptor n=1 Tax=Pseudomonas lopnurensis TaxID=1477517 RepID=UPI00187981B4|nr:TonB-dependent receptor [Pseudomonas lopnurensis]MBE7374233.1 TonB-dependent hemoglobin/transferrin/lactoferrin family receptor [Pseudomonas lopnurensis]
MKRKKQRTSRRGRAALCLGMTIGSCLMALASPLAVAVEAANATQAVPAAIDFDIPAQPLSSGVLAFARQSGVQVFFDSERFAGLQGGAVQGRYSLEEALQRLLAAAPVNYRFFEGGRQVTLSQRESDGGVFELPDITVRDWLSEKEQTYLQPRSVSVIDREQIDRRPPRHVADMLADTPGVTSAVDRNNPSLSVNIRGMQDFGRVNMMIDGMRQNHVESGHQQRNGEMYIDSELLSSVVIEKGPNAGVYGANAIAGSANFQTLDYDDIILPGQDHGVRLRGTTGIGGYANGVNFLGSAAVAGRFEDRLELLAARSQKNLGAYEIGDRGRTWHTESLSLGQQEISEMRYSDQKQDSWLAKARLKLNDDQSVQFTYTGTELSYSNTSDWSQANANGNRSYGAAEAKNDSYALDYAFAPNDNPLIDLKAKVYFVSTENERINGATPTSLTDFVWNNGYCLQNPISSSWQSACLSGLSNTTRSRTDTWGLQLENTSRFELAALPGAEWAANYGIEWFQDEGKSGNTSDRNGVTTSYIDGLTGNNLNPNGRRDVASAFASLTFSKDPFTLKAGLRYDWYHLRGKTTVPGVESSYQSRFDSYLSYWCNRPQTNATNYAGCQAGLNGGEAGAVAWWEANQSTSYWTTTRWGEQWTDEAVRYEYEVDRSMGRFSPFLSAAYKPLDWLEFFGNWGRGFRPPALAETLWEGAHPGGGSEHMYPNPLLDSERSTTWEVGFNILRQNVLKADDRLGIKAAYFATKVDDFVFTSIDNTLPGVNAGGLGNNFFVNNLAETKFRGIELEGSYDAQRWYAGVNFTKYLSSENDFCSKVWPLGSQMIRYDQPNEDGSMTAQHLQAIAAGYSSYQEMLDSRAYCGIDTVMNATRAMPMDRHGATLGIRLFGKKLDMGIRYNRSKGDAPSNWSTADNLWDSYTTWDFYSKYQPTQNLAVSLAVENIRDENYLGGYSDMLARTYAPGRTVQAGVEIRF